MSRLRRLRVAPLAVGRVELSDSELHYASRVLRLRDGIRVSVFDGRGQTGVGVFVDGGVDVETVLTHAPPRVDLTLGVAPPKGERADWLVEKSCELGAARIVWLNTERSISVLDKRLERLRRVAESAARQSGQALIAELEAPCPFDAFLRRDFDHRILAHPGSESPLALETSAEPIRVAVLIGPEAGFTENEVLAATRAGYTPVTLAGSILRIETAAVVATALALR